MSASVTVQYRVAESYYRVTLTTAEACNVFLVSGLTSDYTAQTVAMATINAMIPFASIHPANSRLIADDFEVKPFTNSKTQCLVYVKYHPIDWSSAYQPLITFTGTSREILTNYNYAGTQIKVNYKSGATADPGAHGSGAADGIVSVVGQITRNKAYGILEIERVEYQDPTPRLAYIDCINSDIFWGQPAATWLVRDIVISKLLYTSGFKCRYVLEYDWQTHVKTAVYRDSFSGDIPSDVNTNPDPTQQSGNGWRNVQVNKLIAFAGLQLPGSFNGS